MLWLFGHNVLVLRQKTSKTFQYTCAPAVVTKYQKRISGPILDRIDIHIEVPRVDYEKLSGDRLDKTSEAIRKCIQATRDIQHTIHK